MNNRIKQLAEQADMNLWYIGDGLSANSIIGDKNIEKFAELIVRECTIVIEKNLFKGIGWNTSRAVTRHFEIGDEE